MILIKRIKANQVNLYNQILINKRKNFKSYYKNVNNLMIKKIILINKNKTKSNNKLTNKKADN